MCWDLSRYMPDCALVYLERDPGDNILSFGDIADLIWDIFLKL